MPNPALSRRTALSLAAAAPAVITGCTPEAARAAGLSSWKEGASKRAITDFVAAVTTDGPDFVAPDERIAVFDNDGTLWVEQPVYTEFVFVLDRAAEKLEADPQLAQQPGFAELAAAGQGKPDLGKEQLAALLAATHSGMTPEAFNRDVQAWVEKARHPRFERAYTACVYQPMLELLDYLRANGFKTFIVSGGGVDFMRAFSGPTYGVPPEQVIGSSGQGRFVLDGDVAVVVKEPKLGSVDDREGKPVNIALHIGRRPIAAFGNSDGDLAMLQYVATGTGRRLALIVHHDDADREYAYDRESKVGTLSAALDEAARRGWPVVSMRNDWARVL
jgi:phosphoserine phosphatase